MKRLLYMLALLGMSTASAQSPPEAAHTVPVRLVEPSVKTPLKPGDKIENLFERNMKQPYVLQRLTDRSGGLVPEMAKRIKPIGDVQTIKP